MTNRKQNLKLLLASATLLLLLSPYLQGRFHLLPDHPLGGFVAAGEQPVLDWEQWRAGEYQSLCDSFLNNSIGLRGHLVRLHNQVQWDLFRRHNTRRVVVGKEDYLFEVPYLNSYLGRDYMGEHVMEEKARAYKEVQDTLAAKGVDFMVVIAPSKVAYFPEYIPEEWEPGKKGPSHYDYLARRLPELGVNVVDVDAWFREMKGEAEYPLFPKSGIHWSFYGAYRAADSLLRKMERERGCPMPEMALDSMVVSEQNWLADYDVGRSLNLYRHTNVYPMGYPVFHYAPKPGQRKPKTLVVGDSFYFLLKDLQFHQIGLGGGHFWYYNRDVTAFPWSPYKQVEDLDVASTILEHEQVIVLATAANLYGAPWGFDEEVLRVFGSRLEQRMEYYLHKMRQSPEWMASIAAKAVEQKIELEKMIRLDAEWLARRDLAGEW